MPVAVHVPCPRATCAARSRVTEGSVGGLEQELALPVTRPSSSVIRACYC